MISLRARAFPASAEVHHLHAHHHFAFLIENFDEVADDAAVAVRGISASATGCRKVCFVFFRYSHEEPQCFIHCVCIGKCFCDVGLEPDD